MDINDLIKKMNNIYKIISPNYINHSSVLNINGSKYVLWIGYNSIHLGNVSSGEWSLSIFFDKNGDIQRKEISRIFNNPIFLELIDEAITNLTLEII